jgi:hypothetical protein
MSFLFHSRNGPLVWTVAGVIAQHELLADRLPPMGRSGLGSARNMG